MKILAVDPGEKRIGLAISDPTGTISRPLDIIKHIARAKDAARIVALAHEHGVQMIVVGWALDSNGDVGYSARKSERLAEVIREKCAIPVRMWDESGTTQAAIQSKIKMGTARKKRSGHLDDVAASILLQDFLINNEAFIKASEEKDDQESI